MQAGFAMLEVGSVSKKNMKNILVKNFFDAAIGALMWWSVGSSLAGSGGDDFTDDGSNGFAGENGFFLTTGTAAKSAYSKAGWFFGWTFAAAGCTIVSGAVAERATFLAYCIYSVILTGFVYPPVVHMMWTSGKFSAWRTAPRLFGDCGVIDFAGSGTVHMTGGVAALCACFFMGARAGFPDNLPEGQPMFQALGVFILWMGWYGFNCCSTLYIDGYAQSAAHVAVTTTLGAASGCISTALIGYGMKHYIDPNYVWNGVLAGLVSITSPCAVVSPAGALIVGAIGGVVYVAASKGMVAAGLDDAVDAVAVHGACGFWGVIAAGLFATEYYYTVSYYGDRKDDCAGVFYGGKASGSFAAAWACVGVIIAWVGSTMAILFGAMKAAGILRVSSEIEDMGMDDSKHGGAHSDYHLEKKAKEDMAKAAAVEKA
jgi:Amt family ammonium transporter